MNGFDDASLVFGFDDASQVNALDFASMSVQQLLAFPDEQEPVEPAPKRARSTVVDVDAHGASPDSPDYHGHDEAADMNLDTDCSPPPPVQAPTRPTKNPLRLLPQLALEKLAALLKITEEQNKFTDEAYEQQTTIQDEVPA